MNLQIEWLGVQARIDKRIAGSLSVTLARAVTHVDAIAEGKKHNNEAGCDRIFSSYAESRKRWRL